MKTALEHDTERAQFVMKLAPRIRKLESDTVQALSAKLETSLQHIQRRREEHMEEEENNKRSTIDPINEVRMK